jgi:ABC-type anion transport system duplicated permease subunit
VPVLGFLSFTVVGFMALFPGSAFSVELAAIFAIFTSQAWNMTFSFYQSPKTVPADLDEATRSFRLSPWQRFWRLEVPFSMPGHAESAYHEGQPERRERQVNCRAAVIQPTWAPYPARP